MFENNSRKRQEKELRRKSRGEKSIAGYRNFETKEDIVKKHISELIGKWDQDYKATGKDSNAEMYSSLFQHLKDNTEFYLLLKQRNLMHLFLEVFLDRNGPSTDDSHMWAYTKAFITYGTYGWIEEWISRRMQESSEAMAEMLSAYGMKRRRLPVTGMKTATAPFFFLKHIPFILYNLVTSTGRSSKKP